MNASSSIRPRSFAERADTAVFRTGNKLVLQRIVGVDAVGTHADDRLELLLSVLLNVELPLAAMLLFLVQLAHGVFTQRVTVCSLLRSASVRVGW